jgi:hypothetical protein
MFDQMKHMGALAGLLRDKDKVERISRRVQDTLETVRVVGEAGGGAVRVTVSGKLEVQDVELDPNLTAGMASGDDARLMAQKLIAEAVNDASAKARVVIQREMQKIAEELDLPDMPGMTNLLGIPN